VSQPVIQPAPRQSQEETGTDIRHYLFLFLKHWYWLALGLIIGLTIAWLQLRYATNIYRVKGTVLINQEEQRSISEGESSKT